MKFLSQEGLSGNTWKMQAMNKWSGNELCSHMTGGGHIIPVSRKVTEGKELEGA